MRKLFVQTMLGVMLLPAAHTVMAADEPVSVKLSEIEYGLFNVNRLTKVGSRLPVFDTTDYLNTETDEVPIERNVAFGSRFRINADRGRLLQLLTVWTIPPMDVPGRKEPVNRKSTLGQGENNEVFQFSYRLDNDWEMQPGEWTLHVFLVGVDQDNVKKVDDLGSSPYWVELYKKTFTLKPAG